MRHLSLTDRGGPNSRIADQLGADVNDVPTIVVVAPNGNRIHSTSGEVPVSRWIKRTTG